MSLVKNFKIFFYILTSKEKIEFWILIFLLIIQSFLELISISLVIPLLALVLNSGQIHFSHLSINIQKYSDYIFILIIFIFFFKTVTLYLISKKSFDFAYKFEAHLKYKIFKNFVLQPYKDFLGSKSSKLITDLSVNLRLLTQNFVTPLLTLISDGLILLSILLFLIFYEFFGFLILFLFSTISIFTLKLFVSKILKKIGREKEFSENYLMKIIQNSIGSVKFSKLYNLKNFFLKNFNNHNIKSSTILGRYFTHQQFPRFALELYGLLSIILLIIYFKSFISDTNELVTAIGVFAAAGFKIIPSINRIILSLNAIKFSDSVIKNVEKIKNSFKDYQLEKIKENITTFQNSIELSDISFSYPETKIKILDKISLKIQKNKFYGIVGESGVGKTTLIDLITGLLSPDSGQFKMDDKEINLENANISKLVSYIPQTTFLLDDTLKNNIALSFDQNANIKKIKNVIDQTDLTSLIENHPDGIDLKVGEGGINLSGGQIQRIGIARALYRQAEVLIFDEPTSSLDKLTEKNILDNINKIKNITKIMISHDLNILSNCDYIFQIKAGKLLKKI